MKPRKKPSQRMRALLQKEIHSKCPFCSSQDVDTFEVHHLNDVPDDDCFENEIMVCPTCHAKITVGTISRNDVYLKKYELVEASKRETNQGSESMASRAYNNSNHYEAGVMNFYGKAPTRMATPPDAIQNDAKKRAYIIRLRNIYIDADTYHKDKRVAGSIINNAISKRFGTTALLVSVDYFQDLCIFLKEKIDATIPGRKSLNERKRPLYEPFQE